jgi:PIN domain nuclease of toxin-antitoxin system
MRVLLDTHTFLWGIAEPTKLSATAYKIMEDGDNEIMVSAASAWEIAIKARLGKLRLPARPELFVSEQLLKHYFTSLPISFSHALHVFSLPALHRDPFDRLLVSQSILEQLPIVTKDKNINQYRVKTIW